MNGMMTAAATATMPPAPYNLTPAKKLSIDEKLKLDRCEKVIERGLRTFEEVAGALLEIRNGLLYRQTHSSFEAYCRERWDLGARRGRQLADAAEVMRNLAAPEPWPDPEPETRNHGTALDAAANTTATTAPTIVQPELPAGERQVRPLTRLPKEEQKPAWEEAKASATQRGEPVTARDVEKVVDRRTQKEDRDSSFDENPDGEAFQVATPAPAIKSIEKVKSQSISPTKFEAMEMAQRLWSIAFRAGFPQEKERPWDRLPKSTRDGFISIAYFHLNIVKDFQTVIRRLGLQLERGRLPQAEQDQRKPRAAKAENPKPKPSTKGPRFVVGRCTDVQMNQRMQAGR